MPTAFIRCLGWQNLQPEHRCRLRRFTGKNANKFLLLLAVWAFKNAQEMSENAHFEWRSFKQETGFELVA